MITNAISTRFYRAKDIYQKEGFTILLKKIFTSLISFENSSFYIDEFLLQKRNEADFMPRIKNVTCRIIETTQQLDELLKDGLDLSLLDIAKARYRIEKGAIVTLLFVGRELAWRGWVAMTEQAKNTFNPHPYKVDFLNYEVCGGDALTHIKYRRQGLNTHGDYRRNEFLTGKGIKKIWSIALINNIASQGTHDKLGEHRRYAKARYIRIFGLQFWKETSIKATDDD